MSLYAIGDLHLHYQSELKAQAQLYDPLWKDHEKRCKENCQRKIKDDDVLVLIGDHSWGKNLAQCEKDFDYIRALPGRKILTRGNHDMFWDAGKTAKLNEMFGPELTFLQDTYEAYHDYALVATKGYCFEGPYYLNYQGEIIGWDEEAWEHAQKLIEREERRLLKALNKAKTDGYEKFIIFLHYPPTDFLSQESVFTQIAEEFKVEQLIYAHCHGQKRFHDSLQGEYNGCLYHLASGDFLNWDPLLILE